MVKGAVTVVLVAVAAAFAASVLRARVSEEPPVYENAEERAAGRVALRFAHLDRKRDATGACELTAGELRREMECDRVPRLSGRLGLRADEPFRVIAAVSSRSGLIYIHLVPGNPVALLAVNSDSKVQSIEHYATA